METSKKKVLIVCNFIGKNYNDTEYILSWLSNIQAHYLLDADRQICIVTDNSALLSKSNGIVKVLEADSKYTNDKGFNTFSKFCWMQNALLSYSSFREFDYIAYIQSNARCVTDISLAEFNDTASIICFKHIGFALNKDYYKLYNINPNSFSISLSKAETSDFTYCQASHFICTFTEFLKLYNFILFNMLYDFKNKSFARWYDEPYFNYYINVVKQLNDVAVFGNEYICPEKHGVPGTTAKIIMLNKHKIFKK